MFKIGSILTEEGDRFNIFYDGQTLCEESGEEIMEGRAKSVKKARALAQQLWKSKDFDYIPSDES